jgi:hypothetical protein
MGLASGYVPCLHAVAVESMACGVVRSTRWAPVCS